MQNISGSAAEYSSQRRDGPSVIGMTTRTNDVADVIAANTHHMLLFFTNMGKVGARHTRFPKPGAPPGHEYREHHTDGDGLLTAILPVPEAAGYLTMIAGATVSAPPLPILPTYAQAYPRHQSRRRQQTPLWRTPPAETRFSALRGQNVLRFSEDKVRAVRSAAAGVRAMRFRSDDDYIAGAAVYRKMRSTGMSLLTVTDEGPAEASFRLPRPVAASGVKAAGSGRRHPAHRLRQVDRRNSHHHRRGTVIRTPSRHLYIQPHRRRRPPDAPRRNARIVGFTVYRGEPDPIPEEPAEPVDEDALEAELEDSSIIKKDTHLKMDDEDEDF